MRPDGIKGGQGRTGDDVARSGVVFLCVVAMVAAAVVGLAVCV